MARQIGSIEAALKAMDARFRLELERAISKVAEKNRAQLQNDTRKWQHKPRWITLIGVKQGAIRRFVVAVGDEQTLKIFGFVDKGTKPHVILPKKPGGVLRFNVGYSAKTAPIARANVGSGAASGVTVYSKGVFHPGTDAREFSAYHGLEAQDELTASVYEAIERTNRTR